MIRNYLKFVKPKSNFKLCKKTNGILSILYKILQNIVFVYINI